MKKQYLPQYQVVKVDYEDDTRMNLKCFDRYEDAESFIQQVLNDREHVDIGEEPDYRIEKVWRKTK